MSRQQLPVTVRRRIREAAKGICGYCHSQEELAGMLFTTDHLIPVAAGGSSEEGNLWLSCWRCNLQKATQTHAEDPETGRSTPLFNPRDQRWADHFHWSANGAYIVGDTPTGKATVVALRLKDPLPVAARMQWTVTGLHPPEILTNAPPSDEHARTPSATAADQTVTGKRARG